MIRLTKLGAVLSASEEEVEQLGRCFDRDHCLRLPKLLDAGLFSLLQPLLDGADFQPKHYERIGSELHMEPNVGWDLLLFLANDTKLSGFVRQVTGCGRIGCFSGRVYRMLPGPHHSFV